MPLYEYQCENCGKVFTAAMSLQEREHAEVRCPGCNSKDVRRVITPFIAKTSKKS
jgi:putative FmdB family regulatory protein